MQTGRDIPLLLTPDAPTLRGDVRRYPAHLVRPVGRDVSIGPDALTLWGEAIADGWRATCLSAAEHHGLWVPPTSDRDLHAYRLRTPSTSAPPHVLPHGWTERWPEPDSVASLDLVLRHAVRCLDIESALILAESALNKDLVSLDEWRAIVATAQVKKQRLLLKARTTSQSGSETRVRFLFDRHRIPVQQQVFIPGVGRVDLVVGGIWVIECDSAAHHGYAQAYAEDRRRDEVLDSLGYFITRLSYPQIWRTWARTTDLLLAKHSATRRRVRHPWAH